MERKNGLKMLYMNGFFFYHHTDESMDSEPLESTDAAFYGFPYKRSGERFFKVRWRVNHETRAVVSSPQLAVCSASSEAQPPSPRGDPRGGALLAPG